MKNMRLRNCMILSALMCVVLCAGFAPAAFSQDNGAATAIDAPVAGIDLGEIYVTGAKPQLAVVAPSHSVEVLGRGEIEALPANTLSELLEYVAGLDVRRRAPGGIQADVGIRGSGFNRIAVLVNGIRMNDPQTGHHNMDIPVNIDDIERIEILRGQGSHIYGSGAMAGAINIVTTGAGRSRKREIEIEAAGGKFDLMNAGVSYSGAWGRLSARRDTSDGFRFDTDYENTTIFAETAPLDGNVNVSAGWNEKDFGANEFYVPGWPSRETTRTGFFNASYIDNESDGQGLRVDTYYRRHFDRFDCSVTNPALCSNTHRTYRQGVEVERRFAVRAAGGFLSAGLMGERDRINSTNIGRRSSGHSAAFARYDDSISSRLRVDAGLRADRHAGYTTRWSWSAGAGYILSGATSLRATAGRSYRVPTFTELFYGDPAHVSFAGLAPETAFSAEVGLDVNTEKMDFELSYFQTEVDSLIDWTRASSAAPWTIGNTSGTRFTGVSAGLKYRASDYISWSLSYDNLKISTGGPLQYKYTDSKPVSAARAGVVWKLGNEYTLTLGATYDKLKEKKNVTLADMQLRKTFSRGEYYLRINNIFNRTYQDVTGTLMPGFTAVLGVKLKVGAFE